MSTDERPQAPCRNNAEMTGGGLRQALICERPTDHDPPHSVQVTVWWGEGAERVGEVVQIEWGHDA